MSFSFFPFPNHPALQPQLPSAANPAAASGTVPPALRRPVASELLQPRAGGADASAGGAPRQSLQVLRPGGGQGAAAGVVPSGQHVIDIERPGLPLAGSMAEQAGFTTRRPNCGGVLLTSAVVSGGVAVMSLVTGQMAHSRSDRLGAAVTGLLSTAISVGSCIALFASSRGGRRPAAPAARSNQAFQGDRPEAPHALALRQPSLYGLPLGAEVARFGNQLRGKLGPAGQFDWNVPMLFVDRAGGDQTLQVSHLLTRALRACERTRDRIAATLGAFLDKLATDPELRADLADLANNSNQHCPDRIGIRLGELLLTQALREVRDAAAAPRDVVLTLVLHAATQAMRWEIVRQLEPGELPSADLLLAGFHAMQSTLQQHGVAVPTLFPADDQMDEMDLIKLRAILEQIAPAIVECFRLQSAEAAGSSQAGAASAADRGAGLALLLRQYGGEAYEEILAARLDHLRAPLLAEWQERDFAGRGSEGYWPALDQVFGRAIAGALGGDLTDWTLPAAAP